MSIRSNNAVEMTLAHRVVEIGEELQRWRPFWSSHAFRQPVLPWEAALPDLSRELRRLEISQSFALSDDASVLDGFLAAWFPVARWARIEAVDAASSQALTPDLRGVERDVSGRKLEQIRAFVAALSLESKPRVLDWCAGKAHLGRAIGYACAGAEVVALEQDAVLVQAARRLASRDRVMLRAECCDVMSAEVSAFLADDVHVVALHACGALHRRLLDPGVAGRVRRVSCAPCCFHLGREGHVPRSRAGQGADLRLTPADLRTAVQDVATAQGHARRRREHLQTWQAGFDALLREKCGRKTYTPVSGASAAALSGDFREYCLDVAARKGITLPGVVDFRHWEERGRQRFREVSALDLVRRRFRRLIEIWLVADLGASLEDAGYTVSMRRFCEPQVSPRNLLLQAVRAA